MIYISKNRGTHEYIYIFTNMIELTAIAMIRIPKVCPCSNLEVFLHRGQPFKNQLAYVSCGVLDQGETWMKHAV